MDLDFRKIITYVLLIFIFIDRLIPFFVHIKKDANNNEKTELNYKNIKILIAFILIIAFGIFFNQIEWTFIISSFLLLILAIEVVVKDFKQDSKNIEKKKNEEKIKEKERRFENNTPISFSDNNILANILAIINKPLYAFFISILIVVSGIYYDVLNWVAPIAIIVLFFPFVTLMAKTIIEYRRYYRDVENNKKNKERTEEETKEVE